MNKYLNEGGYFYTQIKQEGVILYDSERHKLARRRKLSYNEIKQQAQEYFDSKFVYADEFLETAKFTSEKNITIWLLFYCTKPAKVIFMLFV